ncbi:hypothetical protein Tco_1114596 [Tanacetum coccineum]|uniref:Uncharacterized protein n=1 Tax=Tanacetum coccineum TaxID=301880 RepID=A0ABQ5IY58_9ASTR
MAKFLEWSSRQATWSGGQDVGVVPKGLEWWPRVLHSYKGVSMGHTYTNSEDSIVTYMAVSSPFEGLSDIGSPRVDGLPMMPEDPYAYMVAVFQASLSPDYVPGPEEPEHAPLSPEFVPESVYPEFMPLEDDVIPDKEQPLPAAVLPTANSLGYIPDFDPEEDDDEDPEEDPVDYPTDRNDEEEPFGDEPDDEDEDDEEEEEEHLAPADSIPPPPVHRTTARISIPT